MYMHKRKKRIPKRKLQIGSSIALVLITVLFTLYHWTNEAIKVAHIRPSIPKTNIEFLVTQKKWTDAELCTISEQTGLCEETVTTFLEQGEGEKLLEFQKNYFAPVLVKNIQTTPITISECLIDKKGNRTTGTRLADIRDGDILITKNSRFLGWRNGHAGLVVDAKDGLVLEAVMLGTNTKLCNLRDWEAYPSFLVLRLREDGAVSKAGKLAKTVAEYAKREMVDIPYYLLAGFVENLTGGYHSKVADGEEGQKPEIEEEALTGTHCAHLVWYAYRHAGIDLDSDGGIFVTPYDIQNSPYLEVVQSYGY